MANSSLVESLVKTFSRHLHSIVLLLFALVVITDAKICHLQEVKIRPECRQTGDVVIGGLLQLSYYTHFFRDPFIFQPDGKRCPYKSQQYFQNLLTFMFAIEEINNRDDLLQNVSLGYAIYGSCSLDWEALQGAVTLISGADKMVPNYSCYNQNKLGGFVGHRLSSISMSMANVAGLYRIPQISYGLKDHSFGNRVKFPSLYHTCPGGRSQKRAVVQLLKHFGWNWVGMVSAGDESSQRSSSELQEALSHNDICIEFICYFKALTISMITQGYMKTYNLPKQSFSQVIIFNGNLDDSIEFKHLVKEIKTRTGFIFIFNFPYGYYTQEFHTLNGSLMLHLHKVEIPGLKDFLLAASPEKYPDIRLLKYMWEITSKCWKVGCDGMENITALDPFHYDEILRAAFQVYTAVYALAHALHEMYPSITRTNSNWEWWKLNHYVNNAHFRTPGGEEMYLDEDGNSPVKFDILNFVVWPNSSKQAKTVGHYHQTADSSEIYINDSAIKWNQQFFQTPTSVCSASCLPGYHKVPMEVIHICCFSCRPCPEGEITNATDMERCFQCLEDQWSNDRRDTCIPRIMVFLSYEDPLGLSIAVVSLLFCLMASVVFGLFMKHKDTPIVKANNQGLSFILLLSLIFSFLCPLLFIGRPTNLTCLLQQVAFGIIFTLSVALILAKTVTVILAFRATKPGTALQGWLGKQLSVSVLIICCLGQVMICMFWLMLSPPFPEYATRVEVGKIIFQCNEGSVTAFYAVIGYMGGLAVLSFTVAFLARKLPDAFNEAQYITFSMLVFCSVWIAFIPAYLSTKGKYMVAVEVFSILASSAGLLGCIFIPKCYIILLRPELNTRSNIIAERKLKQSPM